MSSRFDTGWELLRWQIREKSLAEAARSVERTPPQLLEVFQRVIERKPSNKDYTVLGKLLYSGHLQKVLR